LLFAKLARLRRVETVPTIEISDLEQADSPESVAWTADYDRALVMQTCANCGAWMIERKCKLICTCGYFLSCSDYY
jgi:hypothetical protein